MKSGPMRDMSESQTLPGLLYDRALHQPDRIAYRFFSSGAAGDQPAITYRQLHRQACTIAARLKAEGLAGERVILLCPNGLEFVVAFFGVLYAGSVAVPLAPLRAAKMASRIAGILTDAAAAGVLTPQATYARVVAARTQGVDHFAGLRFILADAPDEPPPPPIDRPFVRADGLAIIQYTSGSTSSPKGVKITHRNFLQNAAMMARASGLGAESIGVNWLPLFHDMGLMGGVIQPMFTGFPITLLAPAAVLARPATWLEAMTQHRATVTGAPNFAYDLCVERVTEEPCAGLDLSRWDVAFSGAEFIRADTLARFADRFAQCGFRRRSFFPCYGLAEATLIVSGGPKGAGAVVIDVERAKLGKNGGFVPAGAKGTVRLVSSGQIIAPQKVVIVDPDTLRPQPEGAIGEIWINGPSVSSGYVNTPDGDDTFGARSYALQEGFLRSGDLGFFRGDDLFVVGRCKDLIIVNGFNHYPEDVEFSVAQNHTDLVSGGGAAFAFTREGRDHLVIVHELRRGWRGDGAGIIEAIKAGVAEHHGIAPYAVVLVDRGTLPQTTSGKLQRHAVRDAFESGTLQPRAAWPEAGAGDRPGTALEEPGGAPLAASSPGPDQGASVVATELARLLGLDLGLIRTAGTLRPFAMDSVMVMRLRAAIAARTGVELDIVELFGDCSIAELDERVRSGSCRQISAMPVHPSGAERLVPSFAQERVWVLEQVQSVGAAYNISSVATLSGPLDLTALERSFAMLVARHEVLRTIFKVQDGAPVAVVQDAAAFQLRTIDLTGHGTVDAVIREETVRPFDLNRDIPIRVTLLRLAPRHHIMVLVLH